MLHAKCAAKTHRCILTVCTVSCFCLGPSLLKEYHPAKQTIRSSAAASAKVADIKASRHLSMSSWPTCIILDL